ncbi:MAG: TIGR03067 domain-containing protein [Pseudomonadota bacterium]|jgi:hypothetical protein|nr:MAG: hypothetical protein DIU56_06515 [Pseudomonadota bacterium]
MNPAAGEALEGTWVPVAASVSGQELAVAELRVARFVLEQGEYRIIDRDDQVVDSGNYTIDESVLPRQMDIIGVAGPNSGRVMLAIFELEGDRLTVCYDLERNERPADMQAKEDQLLLSITYARASSVLS